MIGLAVVVGGLSLWWGTRSSPAERHLEAGAQLLQSGQDLAAEQEWRKAVRLEPDNVEAWELLGDYYQASHNWEAALEAFRQVLRLRPDTPDLQRRLAQCAAQAGDKAATQRHGEAALAQNPGDVVALKILVAAGEAGRRPGERGDEKQLEYLQRLIELQPNDLLSVARLADALTIRRRYVEVRPLVERLLQANPSYAPALSMRGEALFNENPSPQGLAQAEADFKRALQLDPRDLVSRRYLGKLYLRKRESAKAVPHLEEMVRARPFDSSHLFELAEAYQQMGNAKKAAALRLRYAALQKESHEIQVLRSRLSVEPDNFNYNLQIGLLLLKSHHPADVGFYLDKAVKLRPADRRAKAALRQLERLYAQHLTAGLGALKSGEHKKADWHLSRAILLRPNDARTRQALQQLHATANAGLPKPAAGAAAAGAAAADQSDNSGTLNRGGILQPEAAR